MPRPKRLTRAEAKARTRELLLDAAAETFARKGYDGASVEEIADNAGYSIGALYSNFGGKEQLFLELLGTRATSRVAEAARVIEEKDTDENRGVEGGETPAMPARADWRRYATGWAGPWYKPWSPAPCAPRRCGPVGGRLLCAATPSPRGPGRPTAGTSPRRWATVRYVRGQRSAVSGPFSRGLVGRSAGGRRELPCLRCPHHAPLPLPVWR
ncbi:TetR/AcrR family transcriptional regulator [Streptomyces sp. NPDC054765]